MGVMFPVKLTFIALHLPVSCLGEKIGKPSRACGKIQQKSVETRGDGDL